MARQGIPFVTSEDITRLASLSRKQDRVAWWGPWQVGARLPSHSWAPLAPSWAAHLLRLTYVLLAISAHQLGQLKMSRHCQASPGG